MSRDMQERIESACDDLRDWAMENPDEIERDQPHDQIHEIADGACPIYTSDIIAAAQADSDLILNEPELGPAFDGKPTPVNIIAANIYEKITAALWDAWGEIKDEFEERREEWEEAEAEFEAEQAEANE